MFSFKKLDTQESDHKPLNTEVYSTLTRSQVQGKAVPVQAYYSPGGLQEV